MKLEEVIKIAHTFIGYKPEDGFLDDTTSVMALSSKIGIVVQDVLDEEYGEVLFENGKVVINIDVSGSADYEIAFAIGAYVLFGKSYLALSSEENKLTNVFAVSTLVPNISEYVGGDIAQAILVAKTTSIPFPALRAILIK